MRCKRFTVILYLFTNFKLYRQLKEKKLNYLIKSINSFKHEFDLLREHIADG